MADPHGSESRCNLTDAIEEVKNQMRKRHEANQAAVAQAFGRMSLRNVSNPLNLAGYTVSNTSNTPAIPFNSDPRVSQPSHSAPPVVAHIYKLPNGRECFRYHYSPSPERLVARSRLAQAKLTPTGSTSTNVSTPFETPTRAPRAQRPGTTADLANLESHTVTDKSPERSDWSDGGRVFETEEPDPEDDPLRWESWALRQLLFAAGFSIGTIRTYLRDEFDEAIKRKYYRPDGEQVRDELQEDNTASDSQSVAAQPGASSTVSHAQPPTQLASPQHGASFDTVDRAVVNTQDTAQYGDSQQNQAPRGEDYYRGYRAHQYGSAFRGADYGGRRRMA